jgi:very-long-chain ceramide synthase
VWIYLRHYLNLRIILSLFNEFKTIGPYELNWETQQFKSPLSNVIVFCLLAALQALNVFWLYCILRSAYRLVVYHVAKDDRSEAEEEEEGVNVLREKTELLKGNEFANGSAIKAAGNGTAVPHVRRKTAR